MNNVEAIDPSLAGGMAALFIGGMAFFLFLALVFYIFSAICFMKIAQKTGTPNGWFAWIPILNAVLMLQIAKKPVWWIILFFIPMVNIIATIVIMIMVGVSIARQLNKPEWTGWLFFISPINLIILGYWAFSKDEADASSPQPTL